MWKIKSKHVQLFRFDIFLSKYNQKKNMKNETSRAIRYWIGSGCFLKTWHNKNGKTSWKWIENYVIRSISCACAFPLSCSLVFVRIDGRRRLLNWKTIAQWRRRRKTHTQQQQQQKHWIEPSIKFTCFDLVRRRIAFLSSSCCVFVVAVVVVPVHSE